MSIASIRTRALLIAAGAALFSLPALAQTWGLGASLGAVDDVSHRFALDEFHSRNLAGWVQYELEDHVQLRATYGSMKIPGGNSNRRTERADGEFVVAPPLRSLVDYGTLEVSYEYFEGDYTSGVFAGIGGYKIRPQSTPAGLEDLADPNRTGIGWSAGVDGSFRILRHLSFVGKVQVHGFEASGWRAILSADGGLLYRF